MLATYLTFLICLLIPVCLLISVDIYNSYQSYLNIYSIKKNQNTRQSDDSQIINLACIYINKKRWKSCIILLEQQIYLYQTNQNQGRYFHYLGLCYYTMKLYHLAIFFYIQILKEDPNNVFYLSKVGQIYNLMHEYSKAIETYTKILYVDKDNLNVKEEIKKIMLKVQSG